METDVARALDLENPQKWVKVEGVPCFDAHDEYDGKGNLVRRFDRDKLEDLCLRCNLREEATGDLSPFGPGHLLRQPRDKAGNPVGAAPKETDQPAVWGYARGWKVSTFGPSGKIAAMPTFYVRPEHYKEFLSYPRRSVELWLKDGIVDWIGLLRQTPMRDLGLIDQFAQPVNETNIVPRYLSSKPEGEARVFERSGLVLYYSMETAMADAPPQADQPPDMAEGRTGGDEAIVASCMKAFMAQPLMQFLAQKYAPEMGAGMATPGAMNTMPGGQPMSDPMTMQRQGEPLEFAKLQRKVEELEKRDTARQTETSELRRNYQRKEREGELLALQRDGYAFDLAEEMKDSEEESADAFKRHLGRIVKNYQKDPTGPFIRISDEPAEGQTGPKEMNAKEMNECLRYQREKGCEWEEALAQYRKAQ